jgi:hypothetical protein
MEQVRNTYKILVENLKGRCYLEDVQAAGRIILKWILKKYGLRIWTVFTCLRTESSGRIL